MGAPQEPTWQLSTKPLSHARIHIYLYERSANTADLPKNTNPYTY